MPYLYISIAVVLVGFQFNLNKLFQKNYDSRFTILMPYISGLGFFAMLFFLCLNGFSLQFNLFTFFMALAMSVFISIMHILAVVIMKHGKVSVFSTFLMLGSMLLPFIIGVIFLNENLTVARIIGFIILVISLFIPVIEKIKLDKTKQSKWFFALCAIAFTVNGAATTISKLHQINPNALPTYNFLIWTYLFSAVIPLILLGGYLLLKKFNLLNKTGVSDTAIAFDDTQNTNKVCILKSKRFWLAVLITALTSITTGVGYLLQLWGAITVDASVLYPMVTGGTIITSTIIGRILYKEKITKLTLLGILLTLGGTILFLF